jgi:flagellar motor protein MotB
MTNTTDYAALIDEQLLAVALAKPDGSLALPQELEATRVKLEEIAHAANKQPLPGVQNPQNHVLLQNQIDDHARVQAEAQLIRHQQQQQQQQQQLQQQQQQQQQHLPLQQLQQLHHQQLLHHQNLHHSQHQPHNLPHALPHPYDDDPSQYNIQIPEPIIDSKLRIYPVNENTITAEGNLITRPYPEQVFQSREDLNEFIHEFARDNGFGVVIAHSNKKAIYYTCELGGRYRHKKLKGEARDGEAADDGEEDDLLDAGYLIDPQTKTKKLRCPFLMTANFKKSTGVWTLRTTCNEHNHPQLDPLLNHPMLRKRSDELNLLILDLYKIGTKPLHIESKIKDQYPDVLIKREDIYNEIRGYKRKLKKLNRFLAALGRQNLYKKRSNAGSFQQVDLEDDDQLDQVLDYELHHQHQDADAELQRQLQLQRQLHQAASLQHHQHQHQQHQQHQQHLDEQQLQQYQQLQEHDLHHGDVAETTAAAAIAAVANATQQHHHHEGELSMDNIDSRLVGE